MSVYVIPLHQTDMRLTSCPRVVRRLVHEHRQQNRQRDRQDHRHRARHAHHHPVERPPAPPGPPPSYTLSHQAVELRDRAEGVEPGPAEQTRGRQAEDVEDDAEANAAVGEGGEEDENRDGEGAVWWTRRGYGTIRLRVRW